MFKKVLVISALTAMTSGVALANSAPAPYVGASVGVTANTGNVHLEGFGSAADRGVGGFRGIPFNVFGGYGGLVNQHLYLAGELFGTVATAQISDNDMLKSTYSYGAAILPGIMVSDSTLAYVRAGVLQTHFSDDDKQVRTGAQFGLGLQTSLTQNVDLRGEYDYVAYQSIDARRNGIHGTFSPRSDQFNLGLVYKFN